MKIISDSVEKKIFKQQNKLRNIYGIDIMHITRTSLPGTIVAMPTEWIKNVMRRNLYIFSLVFFALLRIKYL